MFDYTNNFPIIQPQPEASKLRYLAYTQTPEFLSLMQGTGKVVDVNRINDPGSWGYASDREDEVTREEYLNANKVLMAEAGDMRGYMEDIAAYFGLNWFKDESQAAVVRGIYMGKEPLSPIKYRDSELTPEALETTRNNLQTLLEQEKGKTADPANLTPNQKRIAEYIDKLTYATAKDKAKVQLGFSPSSFLSILTDELLDKTDFITNRSGADAADLSDIIKLRTEVDPTFKASEWFDTFAADDIVKQGLLQYGISADLIAGAPNEDAAKFIIGRHLSRTDLQQRMAQYTPNWRDQLNLFGTQILNDPDLIPGLALEAGVTVAGAVVGSALGPAGTVGGAVGARGLLNTFGLARGFARLKGVYDASRLARAGVYSVETVAKLPLGMAPNYAKKLGILGALGSTYALGAVGGGLTETFRQKQKIAYAAATMYADPDAQKEYDYEAIAFTSLSSGLAGAALFGLAPALLGAGFGSALNRIKGINLAKYGEPVLRDEFNKQWSLKGTMLGESLDGIKGIIKKEKTIVDGPVDEVMATKAELTGTKPTEAEVVSAASERVDRTETRAIDSTETASIVPEENAFKRYDNETKEEYIARVAPNKLITDIVSFARELSRNVPDALDNLVLSSYEWTKMTDKDKMTVLVDAKNWITKAKEIESKAVGGLDLDRAKVYDTMEKQRKSYIRNLSKNMTKDEYKAFMKQLRGERIVDLPEALVEARKAGATSKEKEAAASEAAAQLIAKAKEIAKDRDKSVRTREEIPAEILAAFDTAATEASLTGKVSEETAADIRANVMGVKAPPRKKNLLTKAIEAAQVKKRLDPQRMEKIQAVAENPRRFIELVEGSKEAASKFYAFVTQMKMSGLITDVQRDLLLAATVHLNFNNKAFRLTYKIAALKQKNYIGLFDRESNTITINSAWKGDSEKVAQSVLHELGHAFVTHNAKGDIYLDMLRLYNIPTSAFSFDAGRSDSMFELDFLNTYHLSNVEETFVQTFSEILFKETQIAVASLNPMQTSILKTAIQNIAESLVLVADVLNMSKYYKAANEVIDEIVKINNGLENNVSVVKFVDALTQGVISSDSVQTANTKLKKLLGTDKYFISNNEWSLVSRMVDSDPSFIVAYSILKTQGKSLTSQADYDYLVKAYSSYKEAQFNSILYRVSEALKESHFYRRFYKDQPPELRTKEERLAFLESYYFDVIDTKKMGQVVPSDARLPTYEDELIGKLRSNKTGDQYGITYWLTSGEALRGELESRGINTDVFDSNPLLSKTILEFVQTYLNGLGLEQTSNYLTNSLYKRFISNMKEGILNAEPPNWSNKDIATSAISEMLKNDLNLASVFQILPAQIEPNLLKTLIDLANKEGNTPEQSVTELLTGIYNAIDRGIVSYNTKTKKWETAQPKVKKKPTRKPKEAEVVKPKEQVKRWLQSDVMIRPDDPRWESARPFGQFPTLTAEGRPRFEGEVTQASLAEIVPEGRTVFHETNLNGVKALISRILAGPRGHTPFFVSDNIDLALGQTGRGYIIELDPQFTNGQKVNVTERKPGLAMTEAAGAGTELRIDKTLRESLRSVIVPNQRGLDALRQVPGLLERLDFDNPIQTERGFQINRKDLTSPDIVEQSKVVKPKEPVKTTEETEVEAIADNSDVVTIDNYMEHLHGLMEKLSRDVESKGKNKGFISKSSEEAIVYIGKIMMGETPKLLASIESGSINTVAKLEAAIRKRGKNVVAEEGKEYRRITVTDPVTGEKTTKKVSVESVVSEEGRTKEGAVAGRMERIEEDGLERENKISLIENINKILQHIPDFITSSERELLDVFRLKPINVDAAKELNVSESTISRRYNTLLKKLNSLFTEAGIDAEVLKDPLLLKDQLDLWSKRNKDTVVAVSKKKPTKAKVKKAEADKPAKVDVDEAEKGKRIAELATKTAKLKNEDPTPVPTPVTTTEPVMAKVTAEVTGNVPEEVLRPEKQADAIIDGDTAAVKEVVTFTPKKPMSVAFNSIEELNGNPEKKAKLLALAPRMGFDAIVFKDGSVLPLKAEEVKVVGRTEINKPVGIETVVSVKVEKGVPVKKITPAPEKPKAAPEGTPVVIKKTGEPKKTAEIKTTKSDVVKTDENIRIERLVNEDRELARANGLDSSFLKKLLSAYWKVMKEVDKDINVPYTPTFMKAWTKFVVINKQIVDANIKLFGDEGLAKFWKEVDRLRSIEQVKKVTVPGYKVRPDTTIFKEAAKSVDEKFIPFVTPGSLKLKEVNGEIVFTSKDALTKAIVNENKVESPVPTPPTPKPDEKIEVVELPDVDEVALSEIDSILEEVITDIESNTSLPLRQSNLIGVVFGGDNRESISWWRELMNWMVNTTQTASATGLTIRSMQAPIRFISRMFDDTRAQTGHLAAAGKDAFRTAAQAKSDEKRIIARISKYQMRINKYLGDMPEKRKALMLSIYRKLTEGAKLTEADVRAAGITDATLVKTLTENSNQLLEVVRQVNKTFLDLEAETGMVKTVDGLGNPVEADRWATVQFDHEQLSRLSPEKKKALVAKLVEARTKRKLESKVLDVNTLIVMGWLDVAPSADAKGTRLFAGDREYRPGLGLNTISKESLDKLRTGITYPIGTDPGNILASLANKGMPDEFFVLKESGVLNVYRMPRVIDDLAESDIIRYREAVSGNVALYHPRWKEYLSNRNLIEAEMLEMIDFKTKSGAYSEFNSKTSSNIDRPLMRTGADEQTALAVPGLLPEEVLSFPEITEVMRTNIAESYFYFLNGRLFELLFQREIDRMLGRKGITIINIFDFAYKHTEKQLKALAESQKWSPEVLKARIKEMADGISRLREEYAINADTLPTIPNKKLYTARAGLAMMKMKVAPGYILSTMTEVMQELIKSNPIELPKNLIDSIRYVFGDIRTKKSKILEEDIGDLPFVIDNFRSEYGDRLVGEISHGSFELDSKIKTKFIDSSAPLGTVDRGVRILETGARAAESLGSLQAVTNFVRSLAMTRWQRRIWKHMSKGRIQKLLEAMEKPDMKVLMNKLLEASATDPVAERKLWKQFASEARKAGFGFEPQEAMIFFRYGLNTKEKINHLNYLIKNSGADSSGRVNINQMVNTYWMHKNNPKPGIDSRMLEEVLSSYSYMLEDLIVKTSSPEPTGLGRITNIDSKSSFGRLWYALTSWVRGYQDSVVLNYASKNTLSYLGGTLVFFGVLDTLTGLFREWVAGREHEDMVEEFTKNPANFAIRVARSSPIMGSANAVLEMFLSGLSALSGGSWRYYGSPMSSIGIGAANAAVRDVSTGISDLAMQTQEFNGPVMAKAIGDITFANSLVNRSPVAVPVRLLEDMGALDQKSAVQKYLDLVQREPYPYAKSQRRSVAKGAETLPITPTPRNIPLERAMFEEARKKQIRPQPLDVSTSNEGVSGILGNLLDSQ